MVSTIEQKYLYDIFISHAEEDAAWVMGYLVDALEKAGVKVHYPKKFQLGLPELGEFENAIKVSKRVLLVLSPAYLTGQFNGFINILSQTYGLESGTWPVIPLILKPVTLPPHLSLLTKLNATDPNQWQSAIDRLCFTLQASPPTSVGKPACPYVGMVAFNEDNANYFYGREPEVELLLNKLRQHPFVAIIGPSGCGKSSLVFAGLIPALGKTGLFGAASWYVNKITPGRSPLDALQESFELEAGEEINVDAFLKKHDCTNLLLVIDQFEELFSLERVSKEKEFINILHDLIKKRQCYIVITVRADFYPELMASSLWHEIQHYRLELAALDEPGLRSAIMEPAEKQNVYIESSLVERLVLEAANEPGVLPFIQETMVILWDDVERRFLSLRAYDNLILSYKARGNGSRSGLQIAMAQVADKAYGELDNIQQDMACRFFLRLVNFGTGRGNTRRTQFVDDLLSCNDDPDVVDDTLKHLANNRLLTLKGSEKEKPQVDISHESLLEGWPRVKAWLDEWGSDERYRRKLEEMASEWVEYEKKDSNLLSSETLKRINTWVNGEYAKRFGYSQKLKEYLVDANKNANLGFNWRGVFVGLILIFSVASFMSSLYGWIDAQQKPLFIRASIIVFVIFFVLFILLAFWMVTRSTPAVLERLSRKIGSLFLLSARLGCIGWRLVLYRPRYEGRC